MRLNVSKQVKLSPKMSGGKPKSEPLDVNESEFYYCEGWRSSRCGVIRGHNPHPHDSEAYEWWRVGWEDNFHGEEYGYSLGVHKS